MSLKDQLQQNQDNQLSKQFDLWKSFLKEREALLDDNDKVAQLEVLDKQIESKESRIIALEQRIETLDKDLKSHTRDHNEGINTLDLYIARRKEDSEEVDNLFKDKQKALELSEKRLEQINKEIQTQNRYLKDGQKQVDTTIAEWNIQLKEFQAESDIIMKEKNSINTDMVRLRQDKEVLENELVNTTENLATQDEVYDNKREEFKTELTRNENALTSVIQKREQIELEIKVRLEVVESREEGIRLKEKAMESREFKLTQDEKAFRSKVGLA